jgi:DEAD/DEAH box helicase domain-containing protein
VLVFYPLKALAADQMLSWRHAAETVGFDSGIVAKIDGSVLDDDRLKAIRSARIIVMTPDVCQAWMMRNVTTPDIRQFLTGLRLLVIDEAHVLEAVFGSHVAFLLRRLQAARAFAARGRESMPEMQIIAASATIANPAQHMRLLTGLDFDVIDNVEDGSPTHYRRLFHLAGGGDLRQVAIQLLRDLLAHSDHGTFIVFADSRQGVERIAQTLDHDGVKPYRSGYEAEDRQEIENALRAGKLRGVVSTSALELGIDIPHFVFGLNLDVPASRKAFRQRVGRVGRAQPGVFAVLAEPLAFRRVGSTFREYWEGSVEPSYLYLGNRFMQFAHARCLAEELDSFGSSRPTPPANVDWPEGFKEIFEYARTGGARPREFDPIHQIGGDDPHLNYPLRDIGEPSFEIRQRQGIGRIGTIGLQQAIREAYPGAVYLHLAKGYRVFEWRNTAFSREIRVGATNAPAITRPLIRTFVNAAVERDGIISGHLRGGPEGFIGEFQLQITERVEGYEERGQKKLYRDLRQENPAMTAKMRDFRTTGVVLRVSTPWFTESGLKQRIADALKAIIYREYSISPRDVNVVATNVAQIQGGKRLAISDAIAVFDATYGSLRLTEPVFNDFPALLDRLERAAELVGGRNEAPLPLEVVHRLREWFDQLSEQAPSIGSDADIPADGWLRVLAPGSRVARRTDRGLLEDIEIVAPVLTSFDDRPISLHYRYRPANAPSGLTAERFVPETYVERVGDEWTEMLWNPATGKFREEEDVANVADV